MKENIFRYEVTADISDIECNLYNARVEIREASDEKYAVEFPNTKNIEVGSNESGLFIHQSKQSLFPRAEQEIKLFVPVHVVPSLKVYGKHSTLDVSGGIYEQIVTLFDDGEVAVSKLSVGSAEISGAAVSVHFDDVTIKTNMTVKTAKGNILAENTFASHSELRVKRGNIGLYKLNAKECALESGKGNIIATMYGNKESFNTTMLTKEGTVTGESVQREGADRNFKAYAERGNIVLDFTGNDDTEAAAKENA